MPLKHILGVDHVVVTVRDLAAAAKIWAGLGFTVSPRGTHSPILGSGNHTIMLADDYVELLGILTETEHNKPTREFLAEREGLERVAFTTDDAAAGAAEITARGQEALGPVHFGRPVELPGGGQGEAKFNVFRWPLDQNPGSVRIFACQHLTRETVWIPELQRHDNGAVRLLRIEIVTRDPAAAAAQLSRLIDQPARQDAHGWHVPSGAGRADFLFYDAPGFAALYPEAVRDGAPAEGAAALVLETQDPAGAARIPGAIAREAGVVDVPAAKACGVVLSFVPR